MSSLVTSVKQRLNRTAKETGQEYNSLLLRYVQERFLYRLSKSVYKDAFILKGALLFTAYNFDTLRPTKDIDFHGSNVTNDLEELKKILKDICSIEAEDAVEFEANTVEVVQITEEREYPGARARIEAKMDAGVIVLWIDLGYGDKIVKGPVEVEFPVLLDFPVPRVKVYSLESAIAEKFEACVKLNFSSSRMKDFYDIQELAAKNIFKLKDLAEAIKETFETRKTDLSERKIIFGDAFKNDVEKEVQWQAFLRRTGLESKLTFAELVVRIHSFIESACENITENRVWNNSACVWE